EEHRVVPGRVRVLLRLALDLGAHGAQPVGPLLDGSARCRLVREIVQPGRVPGTGTCRRLCLPQTDLGLVAEQVPDRLAALALDLAAPVPAEWPEQLAVKGQAALNRGDDEVDVVDAARAH